MKTIDLRNSLEGHVVKWAKGHYDKLDLQTLAAIQRAYCGLPDDWNPFCKDTARLLAETAEQIGVQSRSVIESLFHEVWQNEDNRRTLSTYQIDLGSRLRMRDVILAYVGPIQAAPVKNDHVEVLLPEKLEIKLPKPSFTDEIPF